MTLAPEEALRACARAGARSRFLLTVSVARQELSIFERGRWAGTFRCSTSRFGVGERKDSYQTPRGLHRVARKIGGGWPVGTVFESRQASGFVWQGRPNAAITTRILWLDGLEPGRNRGGAVDTFARYVYIHGVGDETTLGRPSSRGCVHLAADDLIPLYDRLPEGALVWIGER